MAIKKLNTSETEYTGTSHSDIIIANDLGNFIDGGAGNDIIIGGAGDDLLFGSDGNDIILGEGGNDVIDTGNGNNIALGGTGNDNIYGGTGSDLLIGGEGNDEIYGGDGDDILIGGEDNDTFIIGNEESASAVVIQGGGSDLDNAGNEARYIDVEEAAEGDEDAGFVVFDTVTGQFVPLDSVEIAEQTETDVRLNIVTRPGSDAISTFGTTIAGYNAVDTIEFTQSGDFDEFQFSGICLLYTSDAADE